MRDRYDHLAASRNQPCCVGHCRMKAAQSGAVDWEHRAEDVRAHSAISIGYRSNEIDECSFDIFHGKRPTCPIAIERGVQHAWRDIGANSADRKLPSEPFA